MLGDIKNPRLLYAKGGLFVLLGILAVTMILIETPDIRLALLLAITVWAFCRAYYFAFYVVHRYVEPESRFAGLGAAIRHFWNQKQK